MKIVVLQDFELRAEILRPMYDEFPDLGVFPSATVRSFHKGEIIEIDRNFMPVDCFADDGEKLYFQETVPMKCCIYLTRRNRKLAYLFSKKMEEARNLEDALRDAEERTEQAAEAVPESESIHDVLYFVQECNMNQTEMMRFLFLMDSLASQASRYERMLQRRAMLKRGENDVMGKGLPIYSIERCIMETGELFGDGEHIKYVNGKYRGQSQLGRLMHDFSCTNASDMYYKTLAERVRFYKEDKEGVEIMCKAMEDMRNETYREATRDNMVKVAARMLEENKYTIEEIVKISGLTADEINQLKK